MKNSIMFNSTFNQELKFFKGEHDFIEEFHDLNVDRDGYYVAYKPITLPYILFVFIEMKIIHCHFCVMFAMKSMSMCND